MWWHGCRSLHRRSLHLPPHAQVEQARARGAGRRCKHHRHPSPWRQERWGSRAQPSAFCEGGRCHPGRSFMSLPPRHRACPAHRWQSKCRKCEGRHQWRGHGRRGSKAPTGRVLDVLERGAVSKGRRLHVQASDAACTDRRSRSMRPTPTLPPVESLCASAASTLFGGRVKTLQQAPASHKRNDCTLASGAPLRRCNLHTTNTRSKRRWAGDGGGSGGSRNGCSASRHACSRTASAYAATT